MAILKKTPKTKKAKSGVVSHETYDVLKSPRFTEKAAYATEKRAYTFNVATEANKMMIADAIKALYGVTPVKVNIMVEKPRRVVVRGRHGVQAGSKKAVVFLKKGDSIEFA